MKAILTIKEIKPNKDTGGIGVYYTSIRNHLSDDIKYKPVGRRNEEKIISPLRLYKDYVSLKNELDSYDILFVNPSLSRNCILRDGVSTLIALFKKKKSIVFFHGWNPDIENKINRNYVYWLWVKMTFLRADHIIVLSSTFKSKLKSWGYKNKISVETTVFDDSLLKNDFNIKENIETKSRDTVKNILYLGRVQKEKGVEQVLDTYRVICGNKDNYNINLTIAGTGDCLNELKITAKKQNLPVAFPGYVRENAKTMTYKNAHIYVFPSWHGEGMPLSVLEAIAFGLPVLTTRVGGIPDFFEEGKMGFFLESTVPEHIAEKILYLLDRPELMKEISYYNYEYAKKHFYTKKVAQRIEKIISDVTK